MHVFWLRLSLRRALFCLGLIAAGSIPGGPAQAYCYYFIGNGVGGFGGLVAEQIFPTSLGLDYQYNVLNIDPTEAAAISFSLNVGGCARRDQETPNRSILSTGCSASPRLGAQPIEFTQREPGLCHTVAYDLFQEQRPPASLPGS